MLVEVSEAADDAVVVQQPHLLETALLADYGVVLEAEDIEHAISWFEMTMITSAIQKP